MTYTVSGLTYTVGGLTSSCCFELLWRQFKILATILENHVQNVFIGVRPEPAV